MILKQMSRFHSLDIMLPERIKNTPSNTAYKTLTLPDCEMTISSDSLKMFNSGSVAFCYKINLALMCTVFQVI